MVFESRFQDPSQNIIKRINQRKARQPGERSGAPAQPGLSGSLGAALVCSMHQQAAS